MIEMRWVYHDATKGPPTIGMINISQPTSPPIWVKLQFRFRFHQPMAYAGLPEAYQQGPLIWGEWIDADPPSVMA